MLRGDSGEYMTDEYYWYWINNITGISNAKLRHIFNVFDSPREVYSASDRVLESIRGITDRDIQAITHNRKDEYIYKEYCTLSDKKICFTYPGKADYPSKLMNIYDYPYILYYKGRLPDENRPSVAIVGARNCTEYGRSIAEYFAKAYAAMGIQVISGMALGIDAAGQKGAIQSGGYSLAVLGCGVDICYPRANIELYSQLETSGGILSEYAIQTPPKAGQFPLRNRIISALSDALIVVEARKKSGSLISADQALEQNKDVYVVPGRIGDALSEGCMQLIKEGADIITRPEDICSTKIIDSYINANCMTGKHPDNSASGQDDINAGKVHFEKSGLASPKNMVYSQINLFPVSLETIIKNSGIGLVEAEGLLLELELEGLIDEVSKNYYVRKHI